MLPEDALGSAADWDDPHGVREPDGNTCPRCHKTEYMAGKRKGCAECRKVAEQRQAINTGHTVEPGTVEKIITDAHTRREERTDTMNTEAPRWTAEEDAIVRDNAAKGAEAISTLFEGRRTPKAVEQRAKRLNVSLGGTKTTCSGSTPAGPKRTCECGRMETTPGPFAIHQKACPVHKAAQEGRLVPPLPMPEGPGPVHEPEVPVDIEERIDPHVPAPTARPDQTDTPPKPKAKPLIVDITAKASALINKILVDRLVLEAERSDSLRAERDLLIERVDELEQALTERRFIKGTPRPGDTEERRKQILEEVSKRAEHHRKMASFRGQLAAITHRLGGRVFWKSRDTFTVTFEGED